MFHSRAESATVRGMKVKGLSVVLIAAGLGLGGAAPAGVIPDDASADDVPPGMVSFFTTTACPPGWKAADLAAGRLVVGTADPTAIGRVIGTPLGDAEDRVHGHTIAGTIDLPAKSISAADGGNNSGGASGTRTLAGAAVQGKSGLPFVQLTACVRSLQ
jgi:hypothetical protein